MSKAKLVVTGLIVLCALTASALFWVVQQYIVGGAFTLVALSFMFYFGSQLKAIKNIEK